jgi:hypothetical protein
MFCPSSRTFLHGVSGGGSEYAEERKQAVSSDIVRCPSVIYEGMLAVWLTLVQTLGKRHTTP